MKKKKKPKPKPKKSRWVLVHSDGELKWLGSGTRTIRIIRRIGKTLTVENASGRKTRVKEWVFLGIAIDKEEAKIAIEESKRL